MLAGVTQFLPSDTLRVAALEQAAALTIAGNISGDVITTANRFLAWLRAGGTPVRVRLSISRNTGKSDTITPLPKGSADMAQITDTQKFQLTADPEDAAGYDVDVPVTFVTGDEGIATLAAVDGDPKSTWVVSGAPGSTVITATITTLAGTQLSATLAVDVVTGDVAVVNLVAGEPTDK
jgi:hypothetical protein